MLLEQFQNRSGFDTEHGKTCSIPSTIWSYIPIFAQIDQCENIFLCKFLREFQHKVHVLNTKCQSFKFTVKLRYLTTKKGRGRNSYLSQITYILPIKIIWSNYTVIIKISLQVQNFPYLFSPCTCKKMPELVFNVIKRPNVIADLNSSFAYQTLTGKLDKKTFAEKFVHFFSNQKLSIPTYSTKLMILLRLNMLHNVFPIFYLNPKTG